MSAVHVLRPLRRGVAPLAVCLCLAAGTTAGTTAGLAAMPVAAWRDTGEPASAAAHDGTRGEIVLVQAGGAPISPYQEPAPNLFEATGTALWDGKRTLQGVWVAHPMATSARRVRIYNADTGAAVDGALFKRDPALSGPSVLVSSEAAQFLGMTPGDETGLRIVALTPSQKPEAPPAPLDPGQAATPPSAEAPPPVEPAVEPPAEPVTAAAQPQDVPAADRTAPATAPAEPATAMLIPAPRPERPTETRAAGPMTAEATAAETVAAPVRKRPPSSPLPAPEASGSGEPATATVIATATAERGAPKEDATVRPLFQAAPLGDPAADPVSDAAVSDAAGEPTATVAAVTIAEPTPEASAPTPSRPVFQPAPPRPASDALAVAPSPLPSAGISETPAVAAPAPSEPAGAPVSEPLARLGALEPEPAPALPTRSPAAGALSQPYVQAGIFGVAENADRLLGRLKAANLPALGKPMQLNGRPAVRVLAGPFAVAAERDAAVRTIRGMGLRDAAPVAR